MSEPLTLQDLEPTGHSLTDTLNQLLSNLHLPFVLEDPSDLTPSLLLAILESILQYRLPIPISIRESRNDSAKVEAMKIFLGVLESDIIQMDVGLSEVDPRNLAAGEWDEVVFVGELLCWLGKRSGLLTVQESSGYLASQLEEEPEDVFGKARDNTVSSGLSNSRSNAISPSTHSSLTGSANTALSMLNNSNRGSDTTVSSMSYEDLRSLSPPHTSGPVYEPSRSTVHRPHCIHELDDDSFVLSALRNTTLNDLDSEGDSSHSLSYCDCPSGMSGSTPAPVRHSGWLEQVDDEAEIESFEANRRARALNNSRSKSRSYSALGRSAGPSYATPSASSHPLSQSTRSLATSQGVLTRHTSPTQHTLALMNERARLMTELANLSTRAR